MTKNLKNQNVKLKVSHYIKTDTFPTKIIKKNLIAVGDRVLIDPDERTDRTTSGLYLPPTVREIMGLKV